MCRYKIKAKIIQCMNEELLFSIPAIKKEVRRSQVKNCAQPTVEETQY